MAKAHVARLVLAATCAASLTVGCGGDDGGSNENSVESFCDDYLALQDLSGTDEATLREAAALYRRLADEGPAEARDDFNTVADAEEQVANGDALGVDNDAVGAAANRAEAVAREACE